MGCKVCKIARFWCFWGRFLVKNWKQPSPQKKLGAEVVKYMSWFGLKKRLNFRFWPKNQSQFRWRLFFWRPPVLGLKKRLNFCRWSLNFGRWRPFFFFFLETTCFWAEKTFEFPSFPRNSVSIFRQTVWFCFKNNENSGQGRLHFSHSFKKAPPPFPNPGCAPVLEAKDVLEDSTSVSWLTKLVSQLWQQFCNRPISRFVLNQYA